MKLSSLTALALLLAFCSGLALAEGNPAAGEKVYQKTCTACHAAGVAGAPKVGDKDAWAARINKGMDTLVKHAIEGFTGDKGVMPAKGGFSNLSDQEVADAVSYMVGKSR
ncbi:MAG: c-type cytochrome [Gammaproteobacteria bacterium]|nr:c-type cytochrome [Gammaproteobacteria bacterium]MDX5375630.1 c-type cytochrome [Gammaproteobacteria bacterium]